MPPHNVSVSTKIHILTIEIKRYRTIRSLFSLLKKK